MKTPLLILGLVLSLPVFAEVGNADLQQIRSLISGGKYEEALQKHLWFHEESRTSRGMGGVRLSFALSQWAELGKKYPPALQAMREIRETHAARLLTGSGGFPEYHEVSAIDRTLDEKERTYELFLKLDAGQPAIASRCFDVTLELIVANKNFDLYQKYGGDPIARYERIKNLRETNLGMTRSNPNLDNDRFKEYADKSYTDKTVQLINILVQLKRLDEAREIQKRALAYFPTPAIERSLKL